MRAQLQTNNHVSRPTVWLVTHRVRSTPPQAQLPRLRETRALAVQATSRNALRFLRNTIHHHAASEAEAPAIREELAECLGMPQFHDSTLIATDSS